MRKSAACFLLSLICFQVSGAEKWVNWLGNQSCSPSYYCEPLSISELQTEIRDAVSHKRKIRIVGGGFSISDLVCTDGSLISLTHFNKILSVDTEKKLAYVEAGITVKALNEVLASYGLALPNQAAIDGLTVAGALATAAHGTGHTGTLSDFVTQIDLMTADGVIHSLSTATDYEAFAAARVSLGALGVIYAVVLQCEPMFYLKKDQLLLDMDSLLKQYKRLYQENDFFQFVWKIEEDVAEVDLWNKTTTSADASYEALIYHVLDESDHDLFSEIAIPFDELPAAIIRIKQFLKAYPEVKAADVVVRFVAADSVSYLSPSAGRAVAYMTMSIPIDSHAVDFYRAFETLMYDYQGRPHWGKVNYLNYKQASMLYGHRLDKFIQVKQRLDPQSIFSNDFSDRIFNVP